MNCIKVIFCIMKKTLFFWWYLHQQHVTVKLCEYMNMNMHICCYTSFIQCTFIIIEIITYDVVILRSNYSKILLFFSSLQININSGYSTFLSWFEDFFSNYNWIRSFFNIFLMRCGTKWSKSRYNIRLNMVHSGIYKNVLLEYFSYKYIWKYPKNAIKSRNLP